MQCVPNVADLCFLFGCDGVRVCVCVYVLTLGPWFRVVGRVGCRDLGCVCVCVCVCVYIGVRRGQNKFSE